MENNIFIIIENIIGNLCLIILFALFIKAFIEANKLYKKQKELEIRNQNLKNLILMEKTKKL